MPARRSYDLVAAATTEPRWARWLLTGGALAFLLCFLLLLDIYENGSNGCFHT